ncbi:MAG: radical SAM protein [Coriobacteriia bacterium]|nr:radical SAM protein [Coriobacteriia bacterium]
MRYILNNDYYICGWRNLPYAIMDKKKGEAKPMDQAQLELVFKCSGKKDIDRDALDEDLRAFLDMLLEHGVVREAEEGERRTLAYTEYKGVYKSSVQWSITGKCNYKCKHCFQSAPEGVLGEPTLEQCMDIIAQLDKCGIKNVALTGGEPLIRDDFFQIVDEITRRGMYVTTIYSNGKLLTDEFLDQLDARNLRPAFQISFDGVGYHDWLRGVEGAEEIAIAAMRRLKDRGFPFSAAMGIWRENQGSLRESVKLLGSLGCRGLKLQQNMPQGEWANETEHFLSYDETLQIYLDYLPFYKEDGMPVDIQMEGFFSYTKDLGWSLVSDRHATEEMLEVMPPCGVIQTSLYIGPNGAITPCMSMCGAEVEAQFPNMFETPLEDILTDSSYTRLTSHRAKDVLDHTEKCRDCAYRCQCCSGCRAFAVGAEGTDYLGIDPITCKILTEGWGEKLEEVADALFERATEEKARALYDPNYTPDLC